MSVSDKVDNGDKWEEFVFNNGSSFLTRYGSMLEPVCKYLDGVSRVFSLFFKSFMIGTFSLAWTVLSCSAAFKITELFAYCGIKLGFVFTAAVWVTFIGILYIPFSTPKDRFKIKMPVRIGRAIQKGFNDF